ncbi:MAG: alpha/beta hydrolase [Candidatus Binataceae bacterium]
MFERLGGRARATRRAVCLTLVLAGGDDPKTPPFYSEQMVANLPAHLVRFERFANAGHGIAADAPDRYFKVLREFIGS